jgi:hypothetical protein
MNDKNDAFSAAVKAFGDVAHAAASLGAELNKELSTRRQVVYPGYLWVLGIVGVVGLVDAMLRIFGGA